MFVTQGSADVYWEESGNPNGEPLLLAMGTAFDHRMWWPVTDVFTDYRLLTFDNRGVGQTRWDGEPFSIEDLAADALAVMDAAGVPRAHVYGASLGGLTAQEIALTAPDRTASLILGCTGAPLPLGTPSPVRPGNRRRVLALLRYVLPRRVLVSIMQKNLYGPNPDPDVVAKDRQIMLSTHLEPNGVPTQRKASAAYQSRDRLPQMTIPTLVIHGTEDRTVPYKFGAELIDILPDARLITIDGGGHNYHAHHGELSAAGTRDFLAEHRIG